MSDSKFEDLDEDVVAGGEGARGSRSVAGQTRETTDSAVQNVKASEEDDPSAIYEIVHKDGQVFRTLRTFASAEPVETKQRKDQSVGVNHDRNDDASSHVPPAKGGSNRSVELPRDAHQGELREPAHAKARDSPGLRDSQRVW